MARSGSVLVPVVPAARRAFSLVELLIVMALLSLIVVALMGVFSSTQRAFRAGVTQSDVMEGGRAAMGLIAADLRLLAASGTASNALNALVLPGVNLSVEGNYGYNTSYAPLYQSLPGGPDIRTNLLNAIFILGRENTTWTGTGYFVDHTATSYFYPLYRFYITTNIQSNPGTLRAAFYNAVINNLNTGQWTNMSHVIDGVVHLSLHTYDTNGAWLRYDYLRQWPNLNISQSFNEAQIYFFSNTLPMSVELEFAKLEDHAIKRAESLSQNYTRLTNYLSNQSGNVHVFRQLIPIPNADRAAYQ
jgi:prepilin-type N-terminal cleavage/methylation domain-containing protein